MLAALLSATLSNVSGILNVYANVYTYDIWGHKEKNRQADEKKRIKVGRLFTFVFGLVIIALSMLIPFAGGAEKVVITLLTMVMCPLYIPSIWGLFSKRLTGNQLISAMILTWLVGIMARVIIPASVISPSLIESVAGCVLPVLILAIMEVWSARKKYEDNGYQAICEYTDPEADREPTLKEKKAVLIYSHLAVNCFCITIGVVALLLIGLLIAGDPKTLAGKGIVIGSIILMIAMILAYVIYRIIYARRLKMSS